MKDRSIERLAVPHGMLPTHIRNQYIDWLLHEFAACLLRDDPGINEAEAERCITRFADRLMQAAGLGDRERTIEGCAWAMHTAGNA